MNKENDIFDAFEKHEEAERYREQLAKREEELNKLRQKNEALEKDLERTRRQLASRESVLQLIDSILSETDKT